MFPCYTKFVFAIHLVLLQFGNAAVLRVPSDFNEINAAIQASSVGDTVRVQNGTYRENLDIDRNIFITSEFLYSGDLDDVRNTIIDGGEMVNGVNVITVRRTNQSMVIYGFTIQNGDNGILPVSEFSMLHNIIRWTNDGVDYESGSGGICAFNTFTENNDDGIDLDRDVTVDIHHNMIKANGDDGIEIRFQLFEEDITHEYNIFNNIIAENREDGIQIIDFVGESRRTLRIYENYILDNAMAGLGVMDSANSIEDYRGANITEKVRVYNNTFSGNRYGFTGGGNILFTRNIIINSSIYGLKNNETDIPMDYLILYENDINWENSNLGSVQILQSDPDLDLSYRPNVGSIALDSGNPNCLDPDGSICDIGVSAYFSTGPTGIQNPLIDNRTPISPIHIGRNNRILLCLADGCYNLAGKYFPN